MTKVGRERLYWQSADLCLRWVVKHKTKNREKGRPQLASQIHIVLPPPIGCW